MSETKNIMGSVKISDNRITIKRGDLEEVYIKRNSNNIKSWLVFRGERWILESLVDGEDLDELENLESEE